MDLQTIVDGVRKSGGVPNKAALEAIDRLRAAGQDPPLPAPLKVLLASHRNRKTSFSEVSPEPYEYIPLPTSNSIRLLRIHGEDDEGLIHCSLQTVELGYQPVYSCLSYTWGNPFPDHASVRDDFQERDYSTQWPIACNGKAMFVNQNLYDALKEMPRNPVQFEREPGTYKTVLHRNAGKGNEGLVFSALISGADVNSRDAKGRTPLHHAAENGHVKIVDALLEEGSDPNCTDFDGLLALDLARTNDHQDVVGILNERIGSNQADNKEKREVFSAPNFIWVDAICINQEDLDERSQQVLVMDRIYKEARTVLTWLGPEDKLTRTACSTLKTIARQYQQYGDSDIVPYRSTDPEAYEKAGVPYISMSEWEALALLYMRTWFTRAWVLQEAILATDLLMFCGSNQIIFDDLAVATEALWNRGLKTGFPSVSHLLKVVDHPVKGGSTSTKRLDITSQYASAVEYNFYVLMRLKMRWIYDQHKMDTFVELEGRNASLSFTDLVYNTWPLKCKEPHDKVYSLLSLVKPGPGSFEVYPDYKKPVEELYATVTKEILKAQGNLNHLSTLNDRSVTNIPSLPSWVPDYSTPGHALMHNHLYNACGKDGPHSTLFPAQLTSSGPWDILPLRDIHIDTIAALSRPNIGKNTQLHYDPTWWTLLASIPYLHTNTSPPQRESRGEILFRTLTMNPRPFSSPTAKAHQAHLFKRMLMAMIVSEAEKEDTRDSVRSGTLARTLTTLMSAAMQHRNTTISAHDVEDEGIEGPSYAAVRESVGELHILAREERERAPGERQANDGEGEGEEGGVSFLPTLDELEAFRVSGEGRLWRSHRANVLNPDAVTEVVSAASERMARRRLFATKEGRLGMGSNSLEVGDEVWVLEGGRMPLVLRRKGEDEIEEGEEDDKVGKGKGKEKGGEGKERWTLVAPAYVHGVMQGEAVVGREEEWKEVYIE